MKRLWISAALLAVTGCYSESSFTEDIAVANCTMYEDCEYLDQLDYDDFQECEYYQKEQFNFEDKTIYPSGCDFDRSQAIQCIEGINQMTCADLEEGDFPISCEQVCLRGE